MPRQHEDKQFVAERTEALAMVYLTRRPDLWVTKGSDDLPYNLIVHLQNEHPPSNKTFAVELRGAESPVTIEHANKVLLPTMRTLGRNARVSMPVCLFFFTMQDNKGYHTWVLQPVIENSRNPRLVARETADCVELSNEVIEAITQKVDTWYEALDQLLLR